MPEQPDLFDRLNRRFNRLGPSMQILIGALFMLVVLAFLSFMGFSGVGDYEHREVQEGLEKMGIK